MTKLKTLKVTRRQVELLRCLIYPRLRVERNDILLKSVPEVFSMDSKTWVKSEEYLKGILG